MKLVPICEILCYSFNKLNKALKETEAICDVENGESTWRLRAGDRMIPASLGCTAGVCVNQTKLEIWVLIVLSF